MEIGCLILAGGKSSRMGSKKSALAINGTTFIGNLEQEFKGFPELLVSVDNDQIHPEISSTMVDDIYPDCGPMGGIFSALSACKSEALFVLPCDVPLFTKALASRICSYYNRYTDFDALISVTDDERTHPLCGIYHKRCLPVFQACLEAHDFKMMHALDHLRVGYYHTGEDSWQLKNVNTPEEYRKLTAKNILAISGYKNSGKTTLIERLIPELIRRGLRVSTIKHDGHSFEPDVPGTDSHRFFHAGAHTSIVFDDEKCSITRRMEPDLPYLISLADDADLIILEGFKKTEYPKLEILRKDSEHVPMDFLKNRLAYVTDITEHPNQVFGTDFPILDVNNPAMIADFIVDAYHHDRLKG